MLNRRTVLWLGGLGLLLRGARAAHAGAAFEATSVAELLQALGAGTPVESGDVTVTAPDVAENGAAVPVGVATRLPGVKRLLLLVENHPNPLAAAFDIGTFVEPRFLTHLKMRQSSGVMAVALLADGRVFYARKQVQVAAGGCGG